MTDKQAFQIAFLLRESLTEIRSCLDRGISDETLAYVSERVEAALVSLHQAEDAIDENLEPNE